MSDDWYLKEGADHQPDCVHQVQTLHLIVDTLLVIEWATFNREITIQTRLEWGNDFDNRTTDPVGLKGLIADKVLISFLSGNS